MVRLSVLAVKVFEYAARIWRTSEADRLYMFVPSRRFYETYKN
jgi:hypothetical protein